MSLTWRMALPVFSKRRSPDVRCAVRRGPRTGLPRLHRRRQVLLGTAPLPLSNPTLEAALGWLGKPRLHSSIVDERRMCSLHQKLLAKSPKLVYDTSPHTGKGHKPCQIYTNSSSKKLKPTSIGSYLAQIVGNYENVTSTRKQTAGIQFTVRLISAMDDVDRGTLAEYL